MQGLGLESGAEQLPWDAGTRDFAFLTLGRGCGSSGTVQEGPMWPGWSRSPPVTGVPALPRTHSPPCFSPKCGTEETKGWQTSSAARQTAKTDGEGDPVPHLPKHPPGSSPPGPPWAHCPPQDRSPPPQVPQLAAEPTHSPLRSRCLLRAPINQAMPHKFQLAGRSFPSAVTQLQRPCKPRPRGSGAGPSISQ